jgi:DNA repair protein RecN (Recombination protein N)
MLIELRIRDFAVIEELTVVLEPGLNALTGETGAGKSIIVGALSLLLGERASSTSVRPGADRALVEAVFEVGGGMLDDVLAEHGIPAEDELLILRREVAATGRNRAWVNGSPTTATLVGEIGRRLVDLHGQHEHQTLLRPDEQRGILDAFAGSAADAAAVAHAHARVRELAGRRADLERRRAEVQERAELLRERVREIEKAAPRPGEEEALEAEARRLDHVEELGRLSGTLHDALYASESSITARLGELRRPLDQLLRIDPENAEWHRLLEEARLGLEELGRSAGEYAAAIDRDPTRLDTIRRRQDVLFRLKARYGPALDDVLEAGRRARAELDLLDTADFERRELERAQEEAAHALRDRAAQLTRKRKAGAKRLEKAIAALLPELGMPGGRFAIALDPLAEPGSSGAEAVEFRIAVNAGFEPRELARVASGGELSRVMLALKTSLADVDRVPSLVFDEIDAGVGGRVAHQVADRLREVARSHQVFVVTHLAQIAARADHHLVVEKTTDRGTAATSLREVAGDERVRELARLLGGDPESAASIEHARDMLGKG